MKDRWFTFAERTIVLLFLAAALLPVAFIVVEAVSTVVGFPGGRIASLPKGFGYYTLKVTWNSLALAGFVIILALGLGIPAALALSRILIPLRRLWLFLLALPLAAPSLVTAIAVRELLQRAGPGLPSPYGFFGLAISHLFHALPYTILLVSAGFMTIPRDIEEQSYSLGAGRTTTTIRLLLPYILPHILAATTMTLLFSLGDLGAPLILGGGYKVFSLEMYVNFISNWGDKRIPALFGLWASFLFFAVLLFVAELDKGLSTRGNLGPSSEPDSRLFPRILGTGYVAFLALWLIYPYVRVFAGRFGLPSPEALELKPLGSSILLAGLAAPLAILLAVFIADWLKGGKKGVLLPGLILSPAIIPGVIFGFGYLEALKAVPSGGSKTALQLVALVLVLATRSVPFVVIILQSAFSAATIPHDESARSLGASRAASFFGVLLPQVKPFVAVALVVSVFSTITELASTLVLYPPGWRTMAVYVAYYMEEGLFSKAVGMAFLMLLIVEASVLAAGSLLKANPVERQVFLSPFSMLTIDIPKKGRRTRESMKVFAQIIRGKVSRRKASLRFSSRRRRAAAGSDRESLAAMELKLLGMQINPHFFFNTLNTIVHLIETDKDAAIATVGKLSSLFRYSLDASEARSISLAKELEYLRTYLEIEKLRFGDNLSFSLDVPREVMDCQIHPFLIQPIVENAVRHGKDGEGKAYVTLSIRQERPGVLSVIITDYGTANFDPDLLERASGTGIRNVRRRLDNLYGGDLEFSKNLPHGLAVAMRIFTHEGEA